MNTSFKGLVLLLPLWIGVVNGEDYVGGGEEANPGEVPVAPRNDPWPPPGKSGVLQPAGEGSTQQGDLKPLPQLNPDQQTAPTDPTKRQSSGADPLKPVTPVIGDLTADLPGAKPLKKRGPFWVELADLKPAGNVSPLAKQAFAFLADMKKHVYKIAEDLDDGGKERTRLIFTTEALGKDINKTLALWSHDENFRDVCRITKSRVITLEEQLRAQPRKWTHIRWAFRSVQKEIANLRNVTAAKATGEPQPLKVKTKDGRTILIDAPKDPKQLAREEAEARRALSNRQKEQLRDEVEGEKRRRLNTGN